MNYILNILIVKKIIVNKSKNIKSYNINIKSVDNEEILTKYYFNKSKNQYFKKHDIVHT